MGQEKHKCLRIFQLKILHILRYCFPRAHINVNNIETYLYVI